MLSSFPLEELEAVRTKEKPVRRTGRSHKGTPRRGGTLVAVFSRVVVGRDQLPHVPPP